MRGDAAYVERIRFHVLEALSAGDVVPADTIKDAERIGENYRYHLGPLLLIALEQYVGVDVVQKTLSALVSEPPIEKLSYIAFRARLAAAGAAPEDLARFKRECLRAPVASGCVSKLP